MRPLCNNESGECDLREFSDSQMLSEDYDAILIPGSRRMRVGHIRKITAQGNEKSSYSAESRMTGDLWQFLSAGMQAG